MADLDQRGIVTKRRNTTVKKYQGGIPFTYGPLAYLLKNRIYLGEMHHGGKWFKGEHEAILDQQTFDRVQALLKSNTVNCKTKASESGALLQGKLFDDKGNRMGPTFSSKSGVRYRFYVSAALRGRRHKAGSVTRVAAREIESLVEDAVQKQFELPDASGQVISEWIERVVIGGTHVRITFNSNTQLGNSFPTTIDIPWTRTNPGQTHVPPSSGSKKDQKLAQAVIRAHAWLADLKRGHFSSIEELASAAKLHPKVVRQALILGFLAPTLTLEILTGEDPVKALKPLPKRMPLSWADQKQLFL